MSGGSDNYFPSFVFRFISSIVRLKGVKVEINPCSQVLPGNATRGALPPIKIAGGACKIALLGGT